jgi:transcriptional repressor NrdR
MKCPHCNHPDDHVIDSRPVETGAAIRRRRECLACEKRFTTYERLEVMPLTVLKSDNRREPFDRNKLRDGIALACRHRNISAEQIEKIVAEAEMALQEDYIMEVPSKTIGEMILAKLKALDPVA